MTRQAGNLLIRGGTVVPMTDRGVWLAADVAVSDGVISAVGTAPERAAERTLDAHGCLVLPGFVQTHVHVVQSLARGRAGGLSLLEWLRDRIWPYEAALSGAEVGAAARLGIAELLVSGTTTALDMGTSHHHDQVFQAAAELGIRLTSGRCLMDFGEGVPAGLIEDADSSLSDSEALGSRWHGACAGRLRYAVAPRFLLSCSDHLTRGAVDLARRNGWNLHTHASENPGETDLVRQRTGTGNVAALAALGFAGTDTVVAHCVHLDDEEFDLLAETRTAVAHCPGANLKLASGIADLPRMLSRGIRVGLGADGPPCNDRLSIFHEMALAGTLHNLRHGAGAIDPWTVLELATWRGAEALGLGEQVGRLEPGLRGDLVVLRPGLAMSPAEDPADMVVFAGDSSAVRHVVVDGTVVVEDGTLTNGDGSTIGDESRAAARAIANRLGWS